MSLITVANLSKSFGPVDIFRDISFSIPKRARAAIVGPNGIGKTTLLRILAGEETLSGGAVHWARGVKFGFLHQEAVLESGDTLWDECLSAFSDLQALESELVQLEQAMSDEDQAEAALARYGPLQADFEHKGGYTYITRIQQVLTGLGFAPDEYYMPVKHLSGGQRTRALLARLLLSNPEVLILDEPTNHLDIQAVEWLENYISEWDGAALIVSHDRYFLDKVATVIMEMSRSGLELYRGNYSNYLLQRQIRWDERLHIFESEKERMEKDLDYIRRNIAGQNTVQAKGRLRRLSRYLEAVEQLGLEAIAGKKWGEASEEAQISVSMMSVDEATRRIRSLQAPSNRPPILRLNLDASARSGELVLRTYDLVVGYPNKTLFKAEDIELRRLECAALIGPNGAGKTTFLKTILEHVAPLSGEVDLGASLRVGYFAQAHEDLHPERTLVEEIDAIRPNWLLAEIRDYLAKFLFRGEEVFKKVEVLSGGERGRLALAKLSLSDANLLLLDEPTNHLDIPSQEILQEVLAEFRGTILLVSHDRYLIDALASQIWEIDEEQGELYVFKGNYSRYRVFKEQQSVSRKNQAAEERQRKEQEQQRSRQANRPNHEERRRKARLIVVEHEISGLEEDLRTLGRLLENPPSEPGKVQKLGQDYVAKQNQLETLMREWEQLHPAE